MHIESKLCLATVLKNAVFTVEEMNDCDLRGAVCDLVAMWFDADVHAAKQFKYRDVMNDLKAAAGTAIVEIVMELGFRLLPLDEYFTADPRDWKAAMEEYEIEWCNAQE